MRKYLPIVIVLCFGLAAGCAARAPERSAEHPAIVSLNPCTDAIPAEVADPAQLLAISHYSHDSRASSMDVRVARRFRATGGTVEEVLALDPDVVVAGAFLAPATRAAFERLGIRVETVGIASSAAESEAQVTELAALAGHPKRGAALNARIEGAMARARWTGPKVSTLLWQEGGIVPGAATLISGLLENAGFASHSAARGLGQGAYLPLERVLADPPALVLAAGDERMLTHPVLRHLPRTRYARLDGSLLYCGGPTIIRAAGRLAQLRKAIG
jgi:iron complex transport system substrate-binding protein